MKTWFYNRTRSVNEKESDFAHEGNWNWRRVLKLERHAEVIAAMEQKTSAKPGEPEWLALFQAGVTKVANSLSDEDKAELRRKAVEWTKEGPPPEVQRK